MKNKLKKMLVSWLMLCALIIGTCMTVPPLETLAALTTSQAEALREDVREWLLMCDANAVLDISSYNAKFSEYYTIYQEEKEKVCQENINVKWFYEGTGTLSTTSDKDSNGYVQKVYWNYADDNYNNRYKEVLKVKDEILSGIEDDMTELDKIMLINEWYVDNTYYSQAEYEGLPHYNPSRLLVYGNGACSSYANSMRLLMDELGIENELIYGPNHVWNLIKYEGEWYQMDITWDVTRGVRRGNLMMNAARSTTNGHSSWWIVENGEKVSAPECSSTKFENWFAYSVSGKMEYYEGYWYYAIGSDIYRAKSDGSYMTLVKSASSKVTIKDIENGVLIYTVGSETYNIDLETMDITVDEDNLGWTLTNSLLTDTDSWRSGHYRASDGKYEQYTGRACLKSKVKINEGEYKINLSDENYRLLIREYDYRGNMTATYELKDGDIYEAKDSVATIGISIYNKNYANVTFEQYKQMLANGLLSIERVTVTLDVVNERNFDNWRSGNYDYSTGKYAAFGGRVCMKTHVVLADGEYNINLTDTAYHVLIREYNANGGMIGSYNLESGSVYTTNDNAATISISLYNPSNSSVAVATYEGLIEGGLLSITSKNQVETDTKVAVTGVTLNKSSLALEEGNTATLTATVKPSNATDKTVTWSSSDTSVATVNSSGKVTAKGAGTATITVKTSDGGKISLCTVTVSKKSGTSGSNNNGNSNSGSSGNGTSGSGSNNSGNSNSGSSGNGTSNSGQSAVKDVTVSYRTHVQSFGWQDFVSNGVMSGTSGLAKRLEGIEISVNGNDNVGIQYTTHCQSYGWLPWSANGEMNGTEGEAKRLEAIKIQLTGADAGKYDVYYRVHAQSYGWLGWAKNGEPSGTAGYAKRLEGIQIVVVKKGESINTNMQDITSARSEAYIALAGSSPVVGAANTDALNPVIPGVDTTNVAYKTHVQTYGWQGWKYNGAMSGTEGQAKRLEGINIKLTNKQYDGGIAYTTHVQTYGWQGDVNNSATWKKDGEMSGTSGEAKRLEAICITLTGEMAEHYDVYYRVHAQSFGWLDWAKNGAPSGTAGYAKRLEGIEIVLVPKGGAAPGETANPYVEK